MSDRIDQLFKNKLSDHILPPSEGAWSKVQNGLSKKNNTIIYWRVAAGFVLMGLLISTWYLLSKPVEMVNRQISKTENSKTNETPALPNENKPTNIYTIEKEPKRTEVRKNLTQSLKPNALPKKEVIEKELDKTNEASLQTETETSKIEETIAVTKVIIEKPIVIEFTLPTIEESTQANTSLAKSETEKSTGIMKFLETARDVKNGDAEFGNSLRDIKNELFAFEFKKDKTRRN